MIKMIVIKVLLLIFTLVSLNTGWGLCKLSNEENDKRSNQDKGKKGTLAMGMLLCWVLSGIMIYKMVTI
ncbi:hypothetical protein CE91St46_14610 [Eubacteriales bacterium]|nr:hypothetical protein CE91St46_14610 [Eubacteriales bacterium]GKH62987.1 hypothetical protein CE91St47_14560 [Eubacteriales bacterium]